MTDTPMTVKQFLNHVRCQQNKLQALRRQQILIRQDISDVKGQRYDKDKITGSKQSDLCDLVIRLESRLRESSEQIARLMSDLAADRQRALALILLIEDQDTQAIMMDRYICGLSWDAIAGQQHWSIRRVFQLNGSALMEITQKQSAASSGDDHCSELQ
jgi:hypothetical protein